MPLDDREQKILEEIERHLYQEDPKLAHTVAKASLGGRPRLRRRLAILGFVIGLVVMFGSFTVSPLVAGLGFVLMVASAGSIAMSLRSEAGSGTAGGGLPGWLDRYRDRWRHDR